MSDYEDVIRPPFVREDNVWETGEAPERATRARYNPTYHAGSFDERLFAGTMLWTRPKIRKGRVC